MEIQELTPKTIVSREAITAKILETRKVGYAISDQEQTMDLCSIAVPLVNGQKQTVAAINVSLDAMTRSDPKIVEEAKAKLFAKGALISRGLGYEGRYPKIFSQNGARGSET